MAKQIPSWQEGLEVPTLRSGDHDEAPNTLDDRDEAVIEQGPCESCGERHIEIQNVSKREGEYTYSLRCPSCEEVERRTCSV